ncbi:MAG: hypothetical protein MI748_20185, partial [Opitutales bacterium]|nr:hypothetical protein [Opitutales bacterium]
CSIMFMRSFFENLIRRCLNYMDIGSITAYQLIGCLYGVYVVTTSALWHIDKIKSMPKKNISKDKKIIN